MIADEHQKATTLFKALVGIGIPVTIGGVAYIFAKKGDTLQDTLGVDYEALQTGIYAMCGVYEGKSVQPKVYKPLFQGSDINFFLYLSERIKEDELIHVQANIALNGMRKQRSTNNI